MAVKFKTLPAVITGNAGERKQIISTPLPNVYSVSIRSIDTNTGTQYVGDATVNSSNGMPMLNGDTVEIDTPDSKASDGFDVSKLYVVATVANQEFRVMVCLRD
jgi:hypothetical protein